MNQNRIYVYYGIIVLLVTLLTFPSIGMRSSGLKMATNSVDINESVNDAVFINATSGYIGVEVLINETYGRQYTDRLYSVVETSDDYYVIAGEIDSYYSTTPKGEMWLAKIDEDGKQLWNNTYGGYTDENCRSAIQTSDGGFLICGWTFSEGAPSDCDFFLVKTDSSGNELWNESYGGGSGDWGYEVMETSDNHYLICGRTVEFDPTDGDVLLIKVDPSDGSIVWDEVFGGTEYDSCESIIETYDNHYLITGSTSSFGAGGADIWLFSTDSSGNKELNRTFGGIDGDYGFSTIKTSDGGYLIAGRTASYGVHADGSHYDIWFLKTDSLFNVQWNKTYTGTLSESPYALIESSNGTFVCAGSSTTNAAGETDAFLMETNSTGVLLWNYTTGGYYEDLAKSITETSDGGYIFAGHTESFGGATPTNSLGWVLKVKITIEDDSDDDPSDDTSDDCPDDNPLPFDLDPLLVFNLLLILLILNILQGIIFILRRRK